jgi:hypothetical protein
VSVGPKQTCCFLLFLLAGNVPKAEFDLSHTLCGFIRKKTNDSEAKLAIATLLRGNLCANNSTGAGGMSDAAQREPLFAGCVKSQFGFCSALSGHNFFQAQSLLKPTGKRSISMTSKANNSISIKLLSAAIGGKSAAWCGKGC